MKNYDDLIKNNIIDFTSVLLNGYYLIGLSETECLVLLRLHQLRETTGGVLKTDRLASRLSLAPEELTEVISGLSERNFIEMKLETNENNVYEEKYNLNGTYRYLGYLIEEKEEKEEDGEQTRQIKQTLLLLEKRLNKIMTPLDIVTVTKWFRDYKYPLDLINEEIEKAMLRKQKSINMIDRALYAVTRENKSENEAEKAKELFEKIYG